jgi:hypothetical protein
MEKEMQNIKENKKRNSPTNLGRNPSYSPLPLSFFPLLGPIHSLSLFFYPVTLPCGARASSLSFSPKQPCARGMTPRSSGRSYRRRAHLALSPTAWNPRRRTRTSSAGPTWSGASSPRTERVLEQSPRRNRRFGQRRPRFDLQAPWPRSSLLAPARTWAQPGYKSVAVVPKQRRAERERMLQREALVTVKQKDDCWSAVGGNTGALVLAPRLVGG